MYTQLYSEIKKINSEGFRSKLRSVALDVLSLLHQTKENNPNLLKPRIQFLYIHHVFKDEEKRLDTLLQQLSTHHHFISYTEAVKKIQNGKIDKPYICFSSDDGFKNNLAAAKILNKYNIKACFFINPTLIETTSYDEIKKHCNTRLHFPPVEFMNWNDISNLLKMGHEIGSHTMQHINVGETTINDFKSDCIQTFELLKKHCGKSEHFAFPYGRFHNFNDAARKIVFDTGFESCASAERGCHINHNKTLAKEELCIRRDHIVLDWKLNHIFYFLVNNSKNVSTQNNLFPY